MKTTCALLAALLLLTASPAFAFTTESAPVDAHGASFADPDQKFDNLADQPPQGQNQGQIMQFGNSTIEMNTPSRPNTVGTGQQLFGTAGPRGW